MKISFNPKDFLAKLKIAKAATAAKDAKPILQNVKIVADKQCGTSLHATDLQHGIHIRVKCQVDEEGAAVLPTKQLAELLASIKKSYITLETTKGGIALKWNSECYTFLTLPVDDFPDVMPFDAEAYHTIPAYFLQTAIQRTVNAKESKSKSWQPRVFRLSMSPRLLD